MLIPEKLLNKEKEHVEGFSPEVAWVTHSGKTKLNEKLAIRPTSETIMYDAYSKWIRSWKDLPLRLNQWCNIVRWEFKNPVPFLRTREFLWQEGHTVFATKEQAEKETYQILDFYEKVFEDLMAVPVLKGLKSEKEKFAGAVYTLSIETILPNAKAIQAGTSHHLGQNFSKPFKIKFLDKNEKSQYAWQNSWGISTRGLGIMLAVHGDDKGIILPPKIAPNKIVIVPIYFKKSETEVFNKAIEIRDKLKRHNPILDCRADYRPGFKFNEWELKGIPLRIEIGPRDLKENQAVLVRRDTGDKIKVEVDEIDKKTTEILHEIQDNLYGMAKEFLYSQIKEVKTFDEFEKGISQKKIVKASWCGCPECEEIIKDKTGGAKSLNIPFDQPDIKGKCVACQKDAKYKAYFAKSY
jgi:prolyl-tRNA synthetase